MTPENLFFSFHEFEGRLAQLREMMGAQELDLLILDEIEAMTWVCGYGVSETLWRAVGVPLHGKPFLVLRSLDIAPARELSWFENIVGFSDWEDAVAVFAAKVGRRKLDRGRIGLDLNSQSMPVNRYAELCRALPQATFMDIGQAVWRLRWIKSEAEIAYLRKAASIADAAMVSALGAVKVGSRQRDIIKAAATTYLDMGADDGLVGPLTSGSDWDSLHGREKDHALREGEVVHIELVPRFRGYSSRIMRSAVVGQATAEQRVVADAIIAAQDKQLKAMAPGAVARDVDAIVREELLKRGLRSTYTNVTGYTLGCYPATTQRISDFTRVFTPESYWRIEQGMTFHMYTSAKGLAISESVIVNEKGAERLTVTPRQIFECT